MIRYRWVIPACFGTIAFVLAAVSIAVSEKTPIESTVRAIEVGAPQMISGLALEKDRKYALTLTPVRAIPVGHSAVVSASLLRDDVPVFELEDAYWHERGVWREGGESGTWEEQNTATRFTFLVPESGSYDLEIQLVSTSGLGSEQIQAQVVSIKEFPLTVWPLMLGGLFLFGVAGFAQLSARGVMGKFMETLGPGSRLEINDVEYEVVERTEDYEGLERIGMEFRLRDPHGATRWLAVDRYEREHPYLEDQDQLVTHMLFEVPMSPTALEGLRGVTDGTEWVVVDDRQYRYDRDNSGSGSVVNVRNGDTFASDYYAHSYREAGVFPMLPGQRWLTSTRWRASNDIEWSLMEIIDWTRIKVLEHIEGEAADSRALTQPQSPSAPQATDPFGPLPGYSSAETQSPPHASPQHDTQNVAHGHYLEPPNRDGEG